jgi:hypothetical protein
MRGKGETQTGRAPAIAVGGTRFSFARRADKTAFRAGEPRIASAFARGPYAVMGAIIAYVGELKDSGDEHAAGDLGRLQT